MSLRAFYVISIVFVTIPAMAQKAQIDKFQWSVVGTIPAPGPEGKSLGLAGALSGVHDETLIVGGGANFPEAMPWAGGKKVYYDELYAFRKDGAGRAIFTGEVFHLPFKTAYGASCSTPEGIIYVGGDDGKTISKKVLWVRWNKHKKRIEIQYLPDLPFGLSSASVAFHEKMLYVAGGRIAGGVSSNFLALDLRYTGEGWRMMPSLPDPVSHAVMIAQEKNGRPCIYLAGGRRQNSSGVSTLYSSLYEFVIDTGTWVARKPIPYTLSVASGVPFGADCFLLIGGNDGTSFQETERVIAAIKLEGDDEKKRSLMDKQTLLQTSHAGFRKEVFMYSMTSDVWTVVGLIPFEGRVNTNACWWGDTIVIPSGEVKPGIRSPEIISGRYFDE